MEDEATATALECLGLAFLVVSSVAFAVYMTTADQGLGYAQWAYDQMGRQAQEIVTVGDELCCPLDPSAASILQDHAMAAWAGDPGPLEGTFENWFVEPDTTEFTVKASWAPPGGHATHTVDLYRSDSSNGKTAGRQQLIKPAPQGPAYVIPRLDKLSAESSADILTVPVDNIWPYQVDPHGAHEDYIQTTATYQRSYGEAGTREVEMEGYTEVTGAARPAVDVHFREPDWQALEAQAETDLLEVNYTHEAERHFTQVLSKADLAAERTIHEEMEELGGDLGDGAYPQHPFRLQVSLHGPGAVDAGNVHTADDGETRSLTDAYELTILVPRNWTDVEVTGRDIDDNEQAGWNNTTVEASSAGGYRITSFLSTPAEFNTSGAGGGSYRWMLTGGDEIEAPFRFHARPPSQQSSTDLGFHDIRATVESARFSARETADLTVEVASSPGRVHRTLDVFTPSLIPSTPWASQDEFLREGVALPIGAVLKNGGEATEFEQVVWQIPEQHNVSTQIEVLEDFTGIDPDKWTIEDDAVNGTRQLRWDANQSLLDTVDTTCDELEACGIAARIVFDGHGIDPHGLWAPPRLETLYDEENVQPYLNWFIRSQKAWDGVHIEEDSAPGFALAHRSTRADAGPAEGSYRFTLPPTTTTTCSEDEIRSRNEADRQRRDDRVYYDFGPREDGLPHLTPGLGSISGCSSEGRTFTLVGQNGDRWRTDAIGKTSYTSVPGLSGQIFADWQNGLAESSVTSADQVRAGEYLEFTVEIESMLETLARDGIGNATLRVEVYDPYNAWEDEPWQTQTIRKTTGFGDVDDGVPEESFGPAVGSDPEPEADDPCAEGAEGCPSTIETGDPIPPKLSLSAWIPKSTVPGTHLLVVELSWEFTTAEGTSFTETGRLIEPFDVLSPEGDRVQADVIGVTAWDTDWR